MLADLSTSGVDVTGWSLDSRFLHFVDTGVELTPAEAQVLASILTYGPMTQSVPATASLLRLVVPRPGTISPWSSKATDIAHICGLKTVKRIERGIAYYLQAPGPLTGEVQQQLDAILFDRMTEAVLDNPEAASALFQVEAARPLVFVPLLSQGREALVQANAALGMALADD
ncbi:MAG TPA: phosphoribosylformylglycinamidine synthase, partial [Gammaproteobacteria bacterium]|nr:phosphoribosylformylglycinamidine synthase [Gammaproteobacteria bacterium]